MASFRAFGLILALGVSVMSPALADDAEELSPQVQGNIAYVSGGIGASGQQAIRNVEANYNLRLIFAEQGSGEYLADVQVLIEDSHGKQLVDATAEGPIMLMKVPPGTYKILALFAGKPLSKSVTIPAKGSIQEAFYWPAGQ